MNAVPRRRTAVFVLPMIIALVARRRAVAQMRTVDFLLVFASGVLFGVGLLGLIRALRGRGPSVRPG